MDIQLSAQEARVIGVLLEKEVTTPDQYPLSLNALTLGCNQKSNRDPVLQLSEGEVQEVVDELARKHLVLEKSGFGSRVPKYMHRFCNTEFGSLKFTELQRAIVCELLLRGPQTPGELRSRCARMAEVHDVHEVDEALQELTDHQDGPFVQKLEREPGKRESRYAQLFCGEVAQPAANYPDQPEPAGGGRLSRLEQEVSELREELESVKRLLEGLSG